METGGAIAGLLVDKKEILFYILEVAFLEEVVQAARGIEPTAEVDGGPSQSALRKLQIRWIIYIW